MTTSRSTPTTALRAPAPHRQSQRQTVFSLTLTMLYKCASALEYHSQIITDVV